MWKVHKSYDDSIFAQKPTNILHRAKQKYRLLADPRANIYGLFVGYTSGTVHSNLLCNEVYLINKLAE